MSTVARYTHTNIESLLVIQVKSEIKGRQAVCFDMTGKLIGLSNTDNFNPSNRSRASLVRLEQVVQRAFIG